MNPPSNNHTMEPKDLGISSTNFNGVNSLQRKVLSEAKFQRVLHNSILAEPSTTLISQVGHKLPEVLRLKQGSYVGLPSTKISELMKSTNIDNAPTQSLLSVVNGILEESVERRNGEIPHRVACLLRKVVQEIERRISTQAEHLKTQNNLFKVREEKYHSRIKVLEALSSRTMNDNEVFQIVLVIFILQVEKTRNEEKKTDELKQYEKTKMEEKKETDLKSIEYTKKEEKMEYEKEFIRYTKELEDKNMEILTLKKELEMIRKTYEAQFLQLEAKAKEEQGTNYKEAVRYIKELEDKNIEVSTLKQKLETMNETCETQHSQLVAKAKEDKNVDDKDVIRYIKELEDKNMEVLTLKKKLEIMNKTCETQYSQLEAKANEEKITDDEKNIRYMKALEDKNMEILILKQKLETMNQTHATHCSQLDAKAKEEKSVDDKEVVKYIKELDDKSMEILTLKRKLETMNKTYATQCSQLEAKVKEEKNANDKEVFKYIKELEDKTMEIVTLKQNLEIMNKTYAIQCSQLETKAKEEKSTDEKEIFRYIKELEDKSMEISALKQRLETTNQTYETKCLQLEAKAMEDNMANDQKVIRYIKELEDKSMEISTLKQNSEIMNKAYEEQCLHLEAKVKEEKIIKDKEVTKYIRELEGKNMEISSFKQELEIMKKSYEVQRSQLEAKIENAKEELKQKSQEYENLLEKLRNKVKENEVLFESRYQAWNIKENQIQKAMNFQFTSLQTLKLSWKSIKDDVMKEQIIYSEECNQLGINLKSLVEAAENYQMVLTENRKLFNEVQELKGEVYEDIQAFIRSVLDGFNVCIFAYGQTGSGKTYTMSGPNDATVETLGVNYRALNDLFSISTSRKTSIVHSQPNGLAVPDATMLPVKSTSDVIKLMDIGLKNRAKGSTAMNERSSRSHSVVSIHVRGMDKKSTSSLHGNLHLVDLAGSERVDRSEVTGDRLKEAQHINKSLSALGDVIFALSQKSSHIPYRNSKLTQLLQSSLGGQAKTLMLVQINSDVKSFSESLSTLKFAERVSGVELGAAKSTKEGKDVRELMEQVASLKDTILVKDEEIDRLQLLKDLKNVYPSVTSENPEAPSE
ncbi:hypothetical protein VNO78_32391 [Psophocarpus tetragonolobus]|uniref:Kinesin motor domain-containing protein n=1 Tax=Psophocarpus tetragonolobus TaxID=3891 RepID=A0AAN9RQ44_PSOTE